MLNDLYHHDLNLVFARQDGSPLPKSSLYNAFDRILKLLEFQKCQSKHSGIPKPSFFLSPAHR
jgi:hypothetical protein